MRAFMFVYCTSDGNTHSPLDAACEVCVPRSRLASFFPPHHGPLALIAMTTIGKRMPIPTGNHDFNLRKS